MSPFSLNLSTDIAGYCSAKLNTQTISSKVFYGLSIIRLLGSFNTAATKKVSTMEILIQLN